MISPVNSSFSNNPAQTITVDCDIVATGKRAGAEVAQVYVGIPDDMVPEPPKWLKGFAKLSLSPGQAGHVHLILDSRAFSYWDVSSDSWQVVPGFYQITIGSSSRDIRLHGQLRLF